VDVSVLLLEAGGWDRDPWLGIPIAWGRNVIKRRHDWMYSSELEQHLGNRAIPMNRGKLIGGSSSINGMAYVRGHAADYDRWAQSGLVGWSYRDVLPYFRRQETWEQGADPYRGGDGPLHTCWPYYPDPLADAFLEAGASAGHPMTQDYNGAQQEGFGRGQSTIFAGRRCSAATAYLHPVLERRNLAVEICAHVHAVVLEGTRAVGVRYSRANAITTVYAAREILIAAGTINAPQLLMLSGIGDPDELARHGIPVAASLRGVGKNMQDHVAAGVDHLRREPGPLIGHLRLDRILVDLARAHFSGTGFATYMPNNVMAFLRTELAADIPDVQLLFRAAPLAARPYLPPFTRPFADGFGCRPVLLRPESRGTVELASADPLRPMRIRTNFLTTERDLRTLCAAIRLARDVFQQTSIQRFADREIFPGPERRSPTELEAFARTTAETLFHPIGTCKMGIERDPMAVVDSELRVLGLDGLRVVDASVMPDLVGGNINATVIMIAEKAADIIRKKLPPDAVQGPQPSSTLGLHPKSCPAHAPDDRVRREQGGGFGAIGTRFDPHPMGTARPAGR
jgi:choline dehydrogenase/4-pyridoxate dehydrogenase